MSTRARHADRRARRAPESPAGVAVDASGDVAADVGADADTLRRERLLAWFDREQRALPWRADRDPYRVWLSETMLQQTRVETVVPYFHRFLALFPDVRALAAAPLEDVLAAWSGLGYYRRARALHAAAAVVVARHGGELPREHAELLALPGVGPYTAGAIASIAFDASVPLVDGNVERVFARWFALEPRQKTPAFRRATWDIAARLVADRPRPGAWNQALMELGATVCTPRDPACARCPVRAVCRAAALGTATAFPLAAERRAPVDVELLVLIVRDGERFLVERRPADGRMASMWQFPTIEPAGVGLVAPSGFPGGARLLEGEPVGELRHAITHHRIRVRVARGRLRAGAADAPFAWVTRRELAALARTGMTRKIEARGWLDSDVGSVRSGRGRELAEAAAPRRRSPGSPTASAPANAPRRARQPSSTLKRRGAHGI